MKKVLTIAGSDPSGGAGIQADLKTFSYFEVYGMSVITALTAQNSSEVDGIYNVVPDFVKMQLDSILKGAEIDAVKTGMLASSEIAETVSLWIKTSDIPFVVVDPVFVATSGSTLTESEAVRIFIEKIIPDSTLVTPNIPEAEKLSGLKISTPEDMKNAAEIIRKMGAGAVLVKGGHLESGITDILFDGSDFTAFNSERIRAKSTHGTGCTLSAAIAAGLALGNSLRQSVENGIAYVKNAIEMSVSLGMGHFGLNHVQDKGNDR
ncbi:bifunctional hydroxymethylpyrimidine kinase/phosphomethylpyrimidine kinase [bacterium]|nr:bifunctional hydroxymethylpyrimidine kinase/phosphomethylpyrimidine kinase [bacterium]